MSDPIDARLPAHDWTGRRIHPVGPPRLAERLAPLEARIAELEAKDAASTDRIGKLNARIKGIKAQLREARQEIERLRVAGPDVPGERFRKSSSGG